MSELLLDTHALIWFLNGEELDGRALFAIGEAQNTGVVFVSPISAWEAALAIRHRNPARRPDLQGQDAASWFRKGRKQTGARLAGIGVRIALEAARVPEICGHGDPGDCYLIATAHVRNLTLVTRDRAMLDLAEARPEYLRALAC